MARMLEGLDEERFFYYFEEISKIPRGSFHCQAISDYIIGFAKEHKLECLSDDKNNVIIKKTAGKNKKKAPVIMLQGHMDMVCIKNKTSHFDFDTDPLRLEVSGDKLTARHTSLGGDDGIALAYMLAILELEDDDLPAIEAIFTSDEEVGMIGVKALDTSSLKADYLINLDSEEEGVLLNGCAGGCTLHAKIPYRKESFRGVVAKIHISGLKGGHSGVEIDKNLGAANHIMGRVLHELKKTCLFSLVNIHGGTADNAISNRCTAKVTLDLNDQYFIDKQKIGIAPEEYKKEKIKEVENVIRNLDLILREEYAGSDSGINLRVDILKEQQTKCMNMIDTEKFVFFLLNVPQGVVAMSNKAPGLVETSMNLGVMDMTDDAVNMTFSVRSSVESRKKFLADKVCHLIEFVGGDVKVDGDYPCWDVKAESKLKNQMVAIYQEMFEKTPEIRAIHAGLECGYFASKMPALDIISMGPNIKDIHSANETLSISSAKRMYQYVLSVLKALE